MKCPNCGASVPDGAQSCPVCHLDFGVTQKIPVAKAQWCPSCGALVAPGQTVCPKCGSPVAAEAQKRPARAARHMRDLPMIEDEPDSDASDTHAIPRIESAIPSEGGQDAATVRHDRLPRTRTMLFAGIAAFAFFVIVVLTITHPWDPDLYSTRAKTDADTSMSGFPGRLESLTGQDKNNTGGSVSDKEVNGVYYEIRDAYQSLGSYEDKVNEEFRRFDSVGLTGSLAQRQEAAAASDQTAIEISNLMDKINKLSDGDGVYTDDVANLRTLGNWLRNRSDALCSAWTDSVEAAESGRGTSPDEVEAALRKIGYSEGTDSFRRLFEKNYEAWAPVQK